MKKVVGILLIIMLVMQVNLSLAASKSDLKDRQEENNKKIEEIQSDIEEIKKKQSTTMKEVENLMDEISTYKIEINELNAQIQKLEQKINQAEKNISIKEEEYSEQKELTDEILITMYEQGETTYLDVLLSSANMVEFISNYYLVTELTEYNVELLKSIENQRIEIENQKAELENDKKELDSNKASKEAKYNKLKAAETAKKSYLSKLSAQEKEEQKELEKFKADQEKIAEELRRIAEEEKNKNNNSSNNITSTPSKSGYIFPVAGLSKANINTKTYPSYPGHTGVDININVVGKSVVAVKAGTVVTSRAISGSIKNYDSNGKYIGSYSSYGEYIVINHHDGTMTLYAHMKPGSRKVSVGDKVKQGQVIGIVGNTGNCLPRPTPSRPLQGTHLHFEVRINGKPVNPLPYLP